MFYLLCFGKNEFACKEFDETALAEERAEWLIQHGFYDRVILAEALQECFLDEEE